MTTLMSNQLALRDFERAAHKAFWRDVLSWLTRKCNQLLSLDQIRQPLPLIEQHDRGLQMVPLDKIVGSTGRYHDFDRAFFPRRPHLQDRWMSVDKAYHEGVALPPVELVKIGEIYFVSDGNHRVSVARARGQNFIDAHVIEIDRPIPIELPKKCQSNFSGL